MPAYHLFTWSPLNGLAVRNVELASLGKTDVLEYFDHAGCEAIKQATRANPAQSSDRSRREGAVRDVLALAQGHLRQTARLLERVGEAAAARRATRLLVAIDQNCHKPAGRH